MKPEKPLIPETGALTMLGGTGLFFGHFFNFLFNNGQITITGQAIIFFSHAILIYAFIGGLQYFAASLFNRLGIHLSILGSVFVCSVVFVEISAVFQPEAVKIFEAPVTAFIHAVGPLVFVAGLILFSISLIRSNEKISGILLLAGNIVFALSVLFAGTLQAIITIMGSFLTGAGFIYFGYRLRFR